MRLLFFVLFIAALLPSVYGHVRLYRTDITGTVNTVPIRNAPSATSDGAFSVNGPCGGTLVWGKNGAANVKAGDTIKMTIGYNGGHADANNVFRATFACGKPDNDAALRAATAVLANVPTQKEPSSAVANRHTFTITLPAPPANAANADKCTVSVLDQRNWGGCIDLQYPAAVTPTNAPASTSAPGNGGGQTTAPAGGATTTKAPVTTTTAAPPALNTAKLNGAYIIGMGCDSTAPGCCCIQGTLNAQISADKSQLTFSSASLRSNCPGEPTISQSITTTLQADGSYKSEQITIRGEPFTAEVIADKRQVILTNVADDRPSTCSFTATKPPSADDRVNAACSPPTPAQVQACLASIPTLPVCEDNRPADFDTTKCCITCKAAVLPPKPKCPLNDLPRCAAGTIPLISTVTGCPSCVPVIQSKCPIDPRNITACPPGVRPQRGANDCITCLPKPDEKCTPKARAECAKKIADGALPPCELSLDQSYVAEFDVNTCCRKCVPPADQDKPANGVKCTPVEVKQCMDKVPICEDGEKPVKNTTKCCPTCKRAERDCRIQDVAACRRNTTVCAAGEVPVNVAGECCQTCRPAPPKCTPACTDATICIRDITPGSTLAERLAASGRCFPRRNIIARLDVTSINQTVDAASVKALIQEMIERFCELPVKKNLCGATEIARMDIAVQILAIVKTGGKTWAQVRIGFATEARVINGVFRLQSETSISAADACWADDACTTNTDSTEIFTSAFSDASSTGDVTVTDVTVENQPTDAPAAPTDGPSVDPNEEITTRRPRPGTTSSGAVSSTSISFVSILLSFVFFVRNF